MKAILCKITKVESLHPDYRVITDYDNGEVFDEYDYIGVPDIRHYSTYQWRLRMFHAQQQRNRESFCAPGFIREGEPVLRFDWLPEMYLQKYHFDHLSLFGEEQNPTNQFIGGSKAPLRSQVIPAKLIWGNSEHIRCLQTRDYVRTDFFGYDYSEALGFCQFDPPGEWDTWTDSKGKFQCKSNRIF